MSEPQRKLAHELLKSGLSDRGYFTYTQIMALEDILKVLEQPARFERDRDKYFVSVFGAPAEKGAWGWRFEGHHISLHFTMLDGKPIASPTFAGTNPAEVRDGPEKGKRVLGQQGAFEIGERGVRALGGEAALVGQEVDLPRFAFDRCNEEVGKVLARADDPFFHPFIFGSRLGAEFRGGFYGLAGWHGEGHMLRALFEGVVFEHRRHIQQLRTAGAVIDHATLSGGGARSSVWAQMLADCLGIPIGVAEVNVFSAGG